jgi:hypothetical protein
MAAARLQRWSSFLSSYNYIIVCRSTKDNANADLFSRLLLEQSTVEVKHVPSIDEFYEQQIEALPVTAVTVRRHTHTDAKLSQVYSYTLSG